MSELKGRGTRGHGDLATTRVELRGHTQLSGCECTEVERDLQTTTLAEISTRSDDQRVACREGSATLRELTAIRVHRRRCTVRVSALGERHIPRGKARDRLTVTEGDL